MTALFSEREARVLRAAQEVVLPAALAPFPDVVPRIEQVLSDAKPVMRTIIRLAVWALELSPLVSHGTRFSRLDPPRRTAWLERLREGRGRTLFALFKVLLQTVAYDDPAVVRSLKPAP